MKGRKQYSECTIFELGVKIFIYTTKVSLVLKRKVYFRDVMI